MPGLVAVRRTQVNPRDPRLLFEDTFGGNVLNDVLWVKTDTEGKISVSGGDLDFSGGLAAPAWGDPAAVSKQSWARLAGLTIEWQVTPGATTTRFTCGLTDGVLAASGVEAHALSFETSGVLYASFITDIKLPLTYTAAALWLRIVCKATGALYYVSTDNRITWKLFWVDSTVTTTPLYAFIESKDAALTASKCSVYQGYAKPAVYSGTPTAPVPSLGAELDSGNLVVGNWYSITATQANYFFTGCAIGNTFRATATTALDANNKVKLITLSSTLTLVADPGTRYGIVDSAPTLTSGTQCGHWIWVDDEANPLYGVLAYHDGTSAFLEKDVNGTYTQLAKATAAYSAGAQCRTDAVLDGSTPKVGLFYNGVAVGTAQSITDSGFGTRVCGFSTLSTNTPGAMEVHTGVGI